MEPYYADDQVTLYLGDMREVLPALDLKADLVVADPPYAETSLAWDRWPDGWPTLAATVASSMWCFGSMRMFLDRRDQFDGWKLSQDIVGHDEDGQPVVGDVNVVWEKQNGSAFQNDRFKRVHEHALHWYQGAWRDQRHQTPRERVYDPSDKYERRNVTSGIDHTGKIGPHNHVRDGKRLLRSVLKVRNMHGRNIHPDEKPLGLLDPMIKYACPEGGLVVDPFAGSGSTLDAARQAGRRAVGIEAHEPYAEAAALRLSALVLT
ncbi:site-specific DNA-methyltransferase [Streptomyces sp. SDr-06]|uniref:DNA-methyltransferase n=1 Tax=Streptomyces sp. SDr-06 TaxID=2267702 RepID=UPI000DE97CA2|nr:site-specific DNA-methyltransferase [Streptomyces sp. SDr-06]RCH70527.1 site-specific DNA-methyltransferase [Streptomyces sp. SDr-06]